MRPHSKTCLHCACSDTDDTWKFNMPPAVILEYDNIEDQIICPNCVNFIFLAVFKELSGVMHTGHKCHLMNNLGPEDLYEKH